MRACVRACVSVCVQSSGFLYVVFLRALPDTNEIKMMMTILLFSASARWLCKQERYFLTISNYIFTVVFALEMLVKVSSDTIYVRHSGNHVN